MKQKTNAPFPYDRIKDQNRHEFETACQPFPCAARRRRYGVAFRAGRSLAAAKPFSTVFWLCYAPGMASDALPAALPALYAFFGCGAGIFIAAAAVVSSAQELLLICRAETLERDRKWIWLAR